MRPLPLEPGLDKDEFTDAARQALPDLGAAALSFTIMAGFRRDHRLSAPGPALRGRLAAVRADAARHRRSRTVPDRAALRTLRAPADRGGGRRLVAITHLLEPAMFLTGRRADGCATDAARGGGGHRRPGLDRRAALFVATVPVAHLVSPVAATWCRPALVPVKIALTHRKLATARRPGRAS